MCADGEFELLQIIDITGEINQDIETEFIIICCGDVWRVKLNFTCCDVFIQKIWVFLDIWEVWKHWEKNLH